MILNKSAHQSNTFTALMISDWHWRFQVLVLRFAGVTALLLHEWAHLASATLYLLIKSELSDDRITDLFTTRNLFGNVPLLRWAASLLPFGPWPPSPYVEFGLHGASTMEDAASASLVASAVFSAMLAVATFAAYRQASSRCIRCRYRCSAAKWLPVCVLLPTSPCCDCCTATATVACASLLVAMGSLWTDVFFPAGAVMGWGSGAAGGSLLPRGVISCACGNFGLLVWTTAHSTIDVFKVLEHMAAMNALRGAQSGGLALLSPEHAHGDVLPLSSSKAVRLRHTSGKRSCLASTLLAAFRRRVLLQRLLRFGGGLSVGPQCYVGHTRFATSSKPTAQESHPHQWTPTHRERRWLALPGPKPRLVMQEADCGLYLTHNGDFDMFRLFGADRSFLEVLQWLGHVLDLPLHVSCDSIGIAGLLELSRCQGLWCASLRLAYQQVVAKTFDEAFGGTGGLAHASYNGGHIDASSEDEQDMGGSLDKQVPPPPPRAQLQAAARIADSVLQAFLEQQETVVGAAATQHNGSGSSTGGFTSVGEPAEEVEPACLASHLWPTPSLGGVNAGGGIGGGEPLPTAGLQATAMMKALGGRDGLLKLSSMLASTLEAKLGPSSSCPQPWALMVTRRGQWAALAKASVRNFVSNDLHSAMRWFVLNARGTFGCAAGCTLDPGRVTLMALQQPVAVGVYPEEGVLLYSSDQRAITVNLHGAAGSRSSNGQHGQLATAATSNNGSRMHNGDGQHSPTAVAEHLEQACDNGWRRGHPRYMFALNESRGQVCTLTLHSRPTAPGGGGGGGGDGIGIGGNGGGGGSAEVAPALLDGWCPLGGAGSRQGEAEGEYGEDDGHNAVGLPRNGGRGREGGGSRRGRGGGGAGGGRGGSGGSARGDGGAKQRPFFSMRLHDLRTGAPVTREAFLSSGALVDLRGNRYIQLETPPSSSSTTTGPCSRPGAAAPTAAGNGCVAAKAATAISRIGSGDAVARDLADVPRVLQHVDADWADRQPGSLNLATAAAFVQQLHQLPALKAAAKGGEGNPLDVLVVGVEVSLWAGEQFAADLSLVYPDLRVLAMSANKVIGVLGNAGGQVPLTGFPWSRLTGRLAPGHTIALCLSHSGDTFPTLHATRILAAALPGRVFVVTGCLGSKMVSLVGQSFAKDAPFCKRAFDTFAGFRPSEPPTVSVLAMHHCLTCLLIYLATQSAEAADPPPSKLAAAAGEVQGTDAAALPLRCNLSKADVSDLASVCSSFAWTSTEDICGVDGEGRTQRSETHRRLVQQGLLWSWHILEGPLSVAMGAAYIFASVVAGKPLFYSALYLPIGGAVTLYISRVLDAALYVFLPAICCLLLRLFQRRQMLARMGNRSLVIADVPFVHQTLQAYVGKLFSLGYGVATLNVMSGNPGDHFVHRFTHRVHRGLLLAVGRPDGRLCSQARSESWVMLGLMQARVIRSMDASPEVLTVGHDPYVNPLLENYPITLPTNRTRFLCEVLCGSKAEHVAPANRLSFLSALSSLAEEDATSPAGRAEQEEQEVWPRKRTATLPLPPSQQQQQAAAVVGASEMHGSSISPIARTSIGATVPQAGGTLRQMVAARADVSRQADGSMGHLTSRGPRRNVCSWWWRRWWGCVGGGAGRKGGQWGGRDLELAEPSVADGGGDVIGRHLVSRKHLRALMNAARATSSSELMLTLQTHVGLVPWSMHGIAATAAATAGNLAAGATAAAAAAATAVATAAAACTPLPLLQQQRQSQQGQQQQQQQQQENVGRLLRVGDVLESQALVEALVEGRALAAERMLAFMVLFHSMAARVASVWPLRYDLSRSQSGLRVASTAAPVTASDLDEVWRETQHALHTQRAGEHVRQWGTARVSMRPGGMLPNTAMHGHRLPHERHQGGLVVTRDTTRGPGCHTRDLDVTSRS